MTVMGCSSSGGGGGGGGGSQAVQQCEAFMGVTCDRVLECVPGEYAAKADCLGDLSKVIPCADAVSVSASYDQCMDQMQGGSCAVLFPGGKLALPSSCSGVIQVL